MKYIKIIMALLLLFTECNRLTQKEQVFFEKFEYEDFSKFKGCHLFYRGKDKEEGAFIAGFVPTRQENIDTICFINVFIREKNNYKLFHDSIYKNVDSVYIYSLTESFLAFQVSELQVDTIGNVFIALCKDKTTLFMFVNEEELKKRSKETKWEKIGGNWYKPKE